MHLIHTAYISLDNNDSFTNQTTTKNLRELVEFVNLYWLETELAF